MTRAEAYQRIAAAQRAGNEDGDTLGKLATELLRVRREALEEALAWATDAIAECDADEGPASHWDNGYRTAAVDLAHDIRALIAADGGEHG